MLPGFMVVPFAISPLFPVVRASLDAPIPGPAGRGLAGCGRSDLDHFCPVLLRQRSDVARKLLDGLAFFHDVAVAVIDAGDGRPLPCPLGMVEQLLNHHRGDLISARIVAAVRDKHVGGPNW